MSTRPAVLQVNCACGFTILVWLVMLFASSGVAPVSRRWGPDVSPGPQTVMQDF